MASHLQEKTCRQAWVDEMQMLLQPAPAAPRSQLPCLVWAEKTRSEPIPAGKPLHLSAWPRQVLALS